MDHNDLPRICLLLLLISMIVGVGVLTMDKFGSAAVEATVVTNETVTITDGNGTFAHAPIVSISEVRNESDATFDVVDDYNYTASSGELYHFATDADYFIDYTYNKTTTTVTVMNGSVNALSAIGSTWMSLIVTILVLVIIVGLVMTSFAGYKKR